MAMAATAAAPLAIFPEVETRIELEQNLLGLWLRNPHLEIAIQPKWCEPPHGTILAAIAEMRNAGTCISASDVALHLVGHAALADIGGLQYLVDVAAAAPSFAPEKLQLECDRLAVQWRSCLQLSRRRQADDALRAGGVAALEDAQALLAECEPSALGSISTSVGDFLARRLAERRLLLSPWLSTSGLAMVHAWRGVGKTNFAIGCAAAIATGTTFLRWAAVNPAPVLYIDGEMPGPPMQERISGALAGCNPLPSPDHLRLITPDFLPSGMEVPNLSTPAGQAIVMREIRDAGAIVIDNIATLFRTGEDPNSALSWAVAQEFILKLRRRGVAIILVDHDNKAGGNRGTSAKADVLDTIIHLKQPSDYISSQGARFEVHFTKHRGFWGKDAASFEAQLTEGPSGPVWVTRDSDDAEQARFDELVDQGLKERDIREEMGIGGSKVARLKRARSDRGGKSGLQ